MGDERTIGGRYRLERRLGGGGMATVWEADDLELGRRVAVKLLSPEADRARFEREARAAASLAHPSICRIYDFGESEDGPYIVLELLEGGTLADRLEPGVALPDDEAARIAADLAAGLAAAHAHGLVHRDLKPANVLFGADGRARIADFGIARMEGAGTLTEDGTVLGTAAFLAPEQAAGQPSTTATDVYGFGVLLFRLLTGRLPFEADEPLALARMHVEDAPPPVRSLRADAPIALALLTDAALAKDPAERPQDGAALVAALATPVAAPPEATAATAALAPPVPARRRRVRPAVLVAAALVLGTVGAGAAVLATEGPADEPPVVPVDPVLRPKPTTSGRAPATPAPATSVESSIPATTAEEAPPPQPTPATPPPPAATEPPTPTDTAPIETTEPPPPPTETGPAPTDTFPASNTSPADTESSLETTTTP